MKDIREEEISSLLAGVICIGEKIKIKSANYLLLHFLQALSLYRLSFSLLGVCWAQLLFLGLNE